MNTAILCNSQTRKTAKKLTELITRKLIWKRNNQQRYPLNIPSDIGRIIRWGCAAQLSEVESLNSVRAIQTAADKLRTIELLTEQEIPTLVLTDSYPCIGRTIHHSSGEGLWICNNMLEVLGATYAGADYFVKIYPKTREYRVHVAHGMVLFVQEKIGDKSKKIWNKNNGFSFQVVAQDEWRKEIVELALKAVEVVRLDFGAVDIMSDPMVSGFSRLLRQPWYPPAVVCEINTAPALEGYSLEKYVQYFTDLEQFSTIPMAPVLKKKYAKSYRYKFNKLLSGV